MAGLNTSVNKPNIAALIAVAAPMLIWVLNRFVLSTPLEPGEVATMTSALSGIGAWVSVYFTNNAPPQPGD